ncbi:metallophosphoesterase [Ferrimonas lipolytica]|uniref:Metallophosphoesterase n=1 Tax=Ferrimonas lipolytica TaxID=2724191 RepID=A0A6H1UBJ4_9GAMM|nr:metallophosphoesterase [Ferrimonas lipolytica]QIZ76457.1 metallophosphoesterase [Ferrimonas lipolytica]
MSCQHVTKHHCHGTAYFVGDIHGEYHQLTQSLAKVGFKPEQGDQLYSVGDLVDRGKDSARCLEFLEKPWFHAVKGNHEAMMLEALNGTEAAKELWFSSGGKWFEQLSSAEQQQLSNRYRAPLNSLPIGMEIYVEQQQLTFGVVHADFPFNHWDAFVQSGNNITEQQLASCLWSRATLRAINNGNYPDPITGVDALIMGHTPHPIFRGHGNRVWLDTGAGYPKGTITILSAHQIVHMLLR